MFNSLEILKMAAGMASHAAARQSVLARNVANADTPGYRTKDIASFADTFQKNSDDFTQRTTRAGHFAGAETPLGDVESHTVKGAAASPNGNTVSLEREMMKAVETRTEHDLALAVYKSALGIMRTSLGRR